MSEVTPVAALDRQIMLKPLPVVGGLADHAGVPVWNGFTDSWHPTQMLADVATIVEHRPWERRTA